MLFFTSENVISGIIYSYEVGKIIFLTLLSTNFVVKCATKILKIG